MYKEIDLASIEKEAIQLKLLKMLYDLYLHTVQLPVDEYHSTITRREELIRIKRVTSSSLKSSLTAKVAAKIQAERPADRPVLSGLIREETGKTTSVLQSQLKSALDRLTHVQQQQSAMLKEFHLTRANTSQHRNSTNKSTSKKQRGSNKDRVWSTRSHTSNGSTVAAATSQTFSTSTSTPMTAAQQPQKLQQQWGRKRSLAPTQSNEQDSPTAGDNVSIAARRSRNTRIRRFTSNSNTNNAS